MAVDRSRLKDWRVYVVTDARLARGRSHVEIVEAAVAGGADVIQLRDKEASDDDFLRSARALLRITRPAGVPLIVNDRVSVAVAVDAEGVHVGQSDLTARETRQLIGDDRILGVSAESVDDALRAVGDGADYVGVSPVFDARATKSDAARPLGLEGLSEIRRHCDLPLVAIGGIDHDNAASVIAAGADCVAVIRCVVAADDVAEAVRSLREAIDAPPRQAPGGIG